MQKFFKVKENRIACWINPRNFGSHPQSFVFIHGSGGNSGAWSCQYSKLHKFFNIVAVNLPGHGKSSGKGRQDVHDYALDLRDLLEGLNLPRPILVGASLGSAIVLDFAARFPRDAAGIVCVGGGLTMPVNPDIISGFRAQPQLSLDMMVKFSLARENREKLFPSLRKSLGEADVETVAGDMLACSRFDITQDVEKIVAPALVICGSEDKMMPPASSEKIAAGIASAKLVVIAGAGHMVMVEQPEAFNEALRNFAQALPGAAPPKAG
ncbi:MAG: alpha/beta hydrolase [Deltaproteobacteria bacterium]|nr:alpha/beta hydrolase [Deltaproteobacteria bacterium]